MDDPAATVEVYRRFIQMMREAWAHPSLHCNCVASGAHVRMRARAWCLPLRVAVLSPANPAHYYTHYHNNACPECMHVTTLVIPINYQLWIAFESLLQYEVLILYQAFAYVHA